MTRRMEALQAQGIEITEDIEKAVMGKLVEKNDIVATSVQTVEDIKLTIDQTVEAVICRGMRNRHIVRRQDLFGKTY